ncbi:MAG: polysaccharide biosynthesis tyrosine autokinase [Chitinophagales bacterium]|nr:polysaccharide biosynthesis tyrosine autokinase [Chitinophagales bacterium]
MQDQNTTTNANSELWNLSVRDLFYKYVRFLPWVIISVALALLVAYVYLRYATPIYSVGGTLLIKNEAQGGRGDKFDELFVNSRSQNIQSEVEILKSKPLMARVVKKLNLQFNYFAKGKIKDQNIYKTAPFLLTPLQLADSGRSFTLKIKFADNGSFRVNEDPLVIRSGQSFRNQYGIFTLNLKPVTFGKEYYVTYQPTISAAAGLSGPLQVVPKSAGTGILLISLQTTNSQMGADVINVLMDEYSNYTKEIKNITSDQMLEFIDGRIDSLSLQLDSVQQLLLNYMEKNDIVDVESQSSGYFEKIRESDKMIGEQQLQLMAVDGISSYLNNKQNEYTKVPSSLTLNDATLTELLGGYNKLQIEREGLLNAQVPAGNPAIIEIESRIRLLREKLIENLDNIKISYNRTINELTRNSAAAESQLKLLPIKSRGFYEIKRQVDGKQALYNILLEKREQTAISKASTISNSQVVEYAAPTSNPVKPNRRAIQMLAILIGLAIPSLIIFMREVLNDKVTTRFDIEKITTAPILGELGHSYSDNTLIVTKTTRSMVAEQFRIIRSNLQYILNKNEKPVILVTSSFSGEGKSFASTNMGAVMALTGKKTVILEFDIRKPKVLSGLGMPKRAGITNFLVGKTDNLDELIVQVPDHDTLFVLACGPIPPNPSELLLGERLKLMFDLLKEKFDVIIIDTAPVGMVSDAMTLGKQADCTLYIVRQGHTFKKQITMIDEFYRENKLPKVSIIINDIKIKPGYGYYGYGRYGYGYGYGYGGYYEEEHPPQTFFERFLEKLDVRRWFKKKRKK